MTKHLPLLFALALLAGCATPPGPRTPEMALPAAWPHPDRFAAEPTPDWWRQFSDPALDALVAQALDENLEIRQQTARIAEYRARLGLAKAGQLPSIGLQASAAREKSAATLRGSPNSTNEAVSIFSLSGLLSYELDLWGRLAREREAAEATLEQNTFLREAVRLNLLADLVATYFDWRTATQQVAITCETIRSREETLRLQEIRLAGGDIDVLAVQQARSALETARAELPARQQREQMLQGALGILIGLEPASLWDEPFSEPSASITELHRPARIPALLPSELLIRRPDIRAAEAQLTAAHAGIGAARASRYPRINLSTLIGTAAITTGDLFSAPAETWSAGAGLAGPLWDFGRTRRRVETAEAQAEQAELHYRLTVTRAFNDVRNGLILYDTSTDRVEAIERLVATLEETERLAETRYTEGYISILELLDTQRALLNTRLGLAEARRDQLTAIATLCKALGGGWEDLPD